MENILGDFCHLGMLQVSLLHLIWLFRLHFRACTFDLGKTDALSWIYILFQFLPIRVLPAFCSYNIWKLADVLLAICSVILVLDPCYCTRTRVDTNNHSFSCMNMLFIMFYLIHVSFLNFYVLFSALILLFLVIVLDVWWSC